MKLKLIFMVLISCMAGVNLSAHNFFVNAQQMTHGSPQSAVVSIGWGHALPFDDFFEADSLGSYSIYDPSLKRYDFAFDKEANKNIEQISYSKKADDKFSSAAIIDGDSFTKKLKFNDKSLQGTYQISAATSIVQFSMYKDEKGRQKWGRLYLDEIKNAKEISLSLNYQSFAKAFIAIGKWEQPHPIGHDVEFIPLSDLSSLKVGDEVKFKVLFMGEPYAETVDGMPAEIRAYSEFEDSGFIGAFISNGEVKFRVIKPGRTLARQQVHRIY